MVAYNDVSTVNNLCAEQTQINSAIANLDGGGTVTMFTISPPPPDPESFVGMMSMPVSIMTVAPPQELLDQVRAALVLRSNEITTELQALGVTETPPASI